MGQFSYSNVPVLRRRRSRFDLSHGVKTSANVGDLVPYDIQEVYAGDTFKVRTACVSRLASQFVRPIMDNLFIDEYHFFVPSRLLYNKFKNVFGENTESAWANTQTYKTPQLSKPTIANKTVGDYLGLPIGKLNKDVSVLPFRAFAKVYDEWFRDENNVPPMHIQTGETSTSEKPNTNAWAPNNYTGLLPKVAKFHDYFTSCLPAPQKGNSVDLDVGSFSDVPVVPASSSTPSSSGDYGLRFRERNGVIPYGNFPFVLQQVAQSGDFPGQLTYNTSGGGVSGSSLVGDIVPDNLWAKTSSLVASPISVNDLRFAFQYQKMLERDARGGTRYVEYLQSHFGVSPSDGMLQRSEFLGGKRTPLSLTTVTQTSNGTETDPLGLLHANSHTVSRGRFMKSFAEHGFVISVFCIRQFHTYQQGIERFWTRSERTDYFDPVFANIGEQPVFKSQLYGVGTDTEDKPFGYNEAWADLRTRQSRVSGQMRTGVSNSLDMWHLADNYDNAPTLSQAFIEETPKYVDRVITVNHSVQDQFILDFYVQNIAYRELPTYSVPSLIDHN